MNPNDETRLPREYWPTTVPQYVSTIAMVGVIGNVCGVSEDGQRLAFDHGAVIMVRGCTPRRGRYFNSPIAPFTYAPAVRLAFDRYFAGQVPDQPVGTRPK